MSKFVQTNAKFVFLASIGILGGCGAGGSSSISVQGAWAVCSNFVRQEASFSGETVKVKVETFSDVDCKGTAINSISRSGTFKVGAAVADPAGATEIDTKNEKGEMTYSIFKIDGNSILFGAESETRKGQTPADRHNKLASVALKKQ